MWIQSKHFHDEVESTTISKTLFILWLWKCFTVVRAHDLKHSLRKFNKIKIVVQVRTYLIWHTETSSNICQQKQIKWNKIRIGIVVLCFCQFSLYTNWNVKLDFMHKISIEFFMQQLHLFKYGLKFIYQFDMLAVYMNDWVITLKYDVNYIGYFTVWILIPD